jgi:hypothetical protein
MGDAAESNSEGFKWNIGSSDSIYQFTYLLFQNQSHLAKLSYKTNYGTYKPPEAHCEYGKRRILFSEKGALSSKVSVTDADTGELIALISPSKLLSKARIEFPIAGLYNAAKKGTLHIKLEISDEKERRLCELYYIKLEDTDLRFKALDLRSTDPDLVMLSILSMYLYLRIPS